MKNNFTIRLKNFKKQSSKIVFSTFLGLSLFFNYSPKNTISNSDNSSIYTNKNYSSTQQNIQRIIPKSDIKKYVILCFDVGTTNVNKWLSTDKLADTLTQISQKPAHFSYYIAAADITTKLKGHSDIGFSRSKADADTQIRLIQEAIDKGHEVGSHTIRHLHGKNWTMNQWKKELSEFDSIIAHDFYYSGKPYKCSGFRAPYLEWNESLYPVLKKLGYSYDVSPPGDFIKQKKGITIVGLPMYKRNNGTTILGMDYNWGTVKISDSELEQMLNRELKQVFEEKSKQKDSNYVSTSALIISMHFSDWKYGKRTYYEVVSDFLIKLAQTKQYQFISMNEYVNILKK